MRPTVLAALALLLARPAVAGEDALYATFQTSKGAIVVKLLPQEAPNTVTNFVQLAEGSKEWQDPRSGQKIQHRLFDGTLFHRTSPRFVIEGGDPLSRNAPMGKTMTPDGDLFGSGGPGYNLADELRPGEQPFDRPCLLAMAKHSGETNGSQFVITDGVDGQVKQLQPRDCDSESGVCGYTRFGEGVCGCELVRKIARAGDSNTRLEKVVISRRTPVCVVAQMRKEKKQRPQVLALKR
jgi:peptidyl-prolyl cis-trans isomerase A (cyclophilin A)